MATEITHMYESEDDEGDLVESYHLGEVNEVRRTIVGNLLCSAPGYNGVAQLSDEPARRERLETESLLSAKTHADILRVVRSMFGDKIVHVSAVRKPVGLDFRVDVLRVDSLLIQPAPRFMSDADAIALRRAEAETRMPIPQPVLRPDDHDLIDEDPPQEKDGKIFGGLGLADGAIGRLLAMCYDEVIHAGPGHAARRFEKARDGTGEFEIECWCGRNVRIDGDLVGRAVRGSYLTALYEALDERDAKRAEWAAQPMASFDAMLKDAYPVEGVRNLALDSNPLLAAVRRREGYQMAAAEFAKQEIDPKRFWGESVAKKVEAILHRRADGSLVARTDAGDVVVACGDGFNFEDGTKVVIEGSGAAVASDVKRWVYCEVDKEWIEVGAAGYPVGEAISEEDDALRAFVRETADPGTVYFDLEKGCFRVSSDEQDDLELTPETLERLGLPRHALAALEVAARPVEERYDDLCRAAAYAVGWRDRGEADDDCDPAPLKPGFHSTLLNMGVRRAEKIRARAEVSVGWDPEDLGGDE